MLIHMYPVIDNRDMPHIHTDLTIISTHKNASLYGSTHLNIMV